MHRTITRSRVVERVRASHDAGVAAMDTDAGRALCAFLGVEIASLERWDDAHGGRTWYVGLVGEDGVQGYKSRDFRTASSCNRLIHQWRQWQGNPGPMPEFSSHEASHVLSLMHKAVESTDKDRS